MSHKLAIIHTTAITIEPLRALAAEILPGWEVVNFLDDSILPQLRESGGDLEQVAVRWLQYVRFAEEAGAALILSACSSVGELVPRAREQVAVPLVRIDEAMAEEAVHRAERIGVAATLRTTLEPTLRLLRSKAEAISRPVALEPLLVDAAFQRLAAGDRDGHDRLLVAALEEMAGRNKVVVLAQASMARVLPALPDSLQDRFLSSPRLGMEQVKRILEAR
jgi:Asp/Glu/hydantoin racemase